MLEPNFSESQLQSAVNMAYYRYVFEQRQVWVFANVPSLIEEFSLGWDSAFFFPWHPNIPHPDHKGCNFFIQYKLSFELTSAGAKEWQCWNTEFFRFKIPHSTKDLAGKYTDDYHQWECLKKLASQQYPTFYATNATLSKDELERAAGAGTLLNDIPLLDVRGVVGKHKHVTFTQSSTEFLLHSEQEESTRISFTDALKNLSEKKVVTLKAATEMLLSSLKKIGINDEVWKNDLLKISEAYVNQPPDSYQALRTQVHLASFFRKHLGTEMLWLPQKS